MGLSDRDYYREHHKARAAASSGPAAPPPAPPHRTRPHAYARAAPRATGWAPWIFWAAVILAGVIGLKHWSEARRDRPFPPTGQVHWYVAQAAQPTAPLSLQAPGGGAQHFVVQLDQWDTKAPVALIPVRAGDTAHVDMPLGRYRMTLTKGTGWQGPGKLFRSISDSRVAVVPLDFYRVEGRMNGHAVVLEVMGGIWRR